MSENASVALSLFGTIVTWALAWLLVVDHCNKHGENIFVSHLLGICIGSGAAVGAFCVTGALFLPSDSANTATGIGNVGAAILLAYWLAFLFAKRTVVRKQQNKTVDYEAIRQKNAAKRAEKEKALGMPFDTFYTERTESHLMLWMVILFFAAVIYVSVFMLSDSGLDGLTRFLIGFVAVTLAFGLYAVSCIVILPALLICLVLLPFVSISIYLEAWLRIRENIPYVAPTIDTSFLDTDASLSSQSDNYRWLFPLAMGLWLGHMWCDDD